MLVKGLSSFRSMLGIVLQAKLERIDAERIAQLVHGAFERVDADRGSRRPHVHRAGEIELHQLVADFDIVAVIKRRRPN